MLTCNRTTKNTAFDQVKHYINQSNMTSQIAAYIGGIRPVFLSRTCPSHRNHINYVVYFLDIIWRHFRLAWQFYNKFILQWAEEVHKWWRHFPMHLFPFAWRHDDVRLRYVLQQHFTWHFIITSYVEAKHYDWQARLRSLYSQFPFSFVLKSARR